MMCMLISRYLQIREMLATIDGESFILNSELHNHHQENNIAIHIYVLIEYIFVKYFCNDY